MRGRRHCPDVLRHIRADGTVRAGQRGRGCPHETSRGIAQTGNGNVARARTPKARTGQAAIIDIPSFRTDRMGYKDAANLFWVECPDPNSIFKTCLCVQKKKKLHFKIK